MTLERFVRLHAVLCTASGRPSDMWLIQMREYEIAVHELRRRGIDFEEELRKRFGFTRGFSRDAEMEKGIATKRRYRARLGSVGGTTSNGG